ncbi:UDP-2,4-diacetamido-2,4,6-trideoxy-beta-L-altropyranose hydrolase [Joostella sp.]|uniref:UDP-2,4-diacetamido-2,4, 6-trideoxy-beta-L-altropyranose hydrolase n=1 Tax=Joostella sp. TaxID=2231138 RepID=UPI003A8D2667
MSIVFRADGDASTGLGHLYRIFALIEMLKVDFEYCLFVRDSSTISVIPEGYNLELISADVCINDEAKLIANKYSAESTILIVDGYQFNSAYQKRVKEEGFKLFYIDDLTTEYMYADVVINHSPHVKESDYNSEPYTRFALGTDYAILRPLFLEAAKRNRQIDKIETAFVCFGGSDYNGLTFTAVKGLLHLECISKIYVVLGAAFSDDRVLNLINKNKSKIDLKQNLSEKQMVDVISKCQLAIVPTSSICYEVSSVKAFIFAGYYVDNQKEIYEALFYDEVIVGGGDLNLLTADDYKELIQMNIINSLSINQKYLRHQKNAFDGLSSNRILSLINNLI